LFDLIYSDKFTLISDVTTEDRLTRLKHCLCTIILC
jgi:hypothetical protein